MPLHLTFTTLIDHLGTFAFAVSGIRSASAKNFDLFGAYIIGLVTAIGGGTLRDILLNVTPFWMQQPSYMIITGIALLSILFFDKKIFALNKTLFLFDTIGLALFVTIGIEKSLNAGFPFWVSIIMGTITGCVGGVIRDVLVNEVPLLFRRDIYALACVAGGIAYFIFAKLGLPPFLVKSITALVVIGTRLVAVKYHIHMPTLKGHQRD